MNTDNIYNRKSINRGFIYFISVIGIICLLVITVCLSFDAYTSYQEISKQKFKEGSALSGSFQEIELAKNTLYENGVVSIMIDSIDRNANWNYFVSDNGKSVVEVKGVIPTVDIPSFIEATDSSRVYMVSTDLKSKVAEDISELKFRIQFIKQLGIKNDTPYNNYAVGYAEYILTDKESEEANVNAYSSEIFDIMEAYVASKW